MDTSKAIHRPMPPHNDSKPLGKNDASVQKSADSSDLLRRDRSNYVSSYLRSRSRELSKKGLKSVRRSTRASRRAIIQRQKARAMRSSRRDQTAQSKGSTERKTFSDSRSLFPLDTNVSVTEEGEASSPAYSTTHACTSQPFQDGTGDNLSVVRIESESIGGQYHQHFSKAFTAVGLRRKAKQVGRDAPILLDFGGAGKHHIKIQALRGQEQQMESQRQQRLVFTTLGKYVRATKHHLLIPIQK